MSRCKHGYRPKSKNEKLLGRQSNDKEQNDAAEKETTTKIDEAPKERLGKLRFCLHLLPSVNLLFLLSLTGKLIY